MLEIDPQAQEAPDKDCVGMFASIDLEFYSIRVHNGFKDMERSGHTWEGRGNASATSLIQH